MAPIFLLSGTLFVLCSVFSVVAGLQQPEVVYTKFPRRQGSLKFFANSSSALYIDSFVNGTTYVTHDDGKTWSEAELPSDVHKDVLMHPFDNRFALVETNEGPYYRTTDQGLTWQPFDVHGSRSYFTDRFSFHSHPNSSNYILMGRDRCVPSERTGQICHTDYYYTRDGFSTEPTLLLRNARSCLFAHSSKEFVHDEHRDLIFCIVSERSDDAPYSSRLFGSSDFFNDDKQVYLRIGPESYNVGGFSIVGRYAIGRLHAESGRDSTGLSVISSDLKVWSRIFFADAQRSPSYSVFPFSGSKLATSDDRSRMSGMLYVSDLNGNNYVESLKNIESPTWLRPFDYDRIGGVEHVGITGIVANPEERRAGSLVRSRITFDDGSTWKRLVPSSEDASASVASCDPVDEENCSLHLHRTGRFSMDFPDNRNGGDKKTSSPAPGVAIRVGSIGPHRASYEDCDMFITTNAGLNWKLLMREPHMVEYANHGSLIVLVKDKDDTDEVLYSNDSGLSWTAIKLEHRIHPVKLSASPDSMSQKFILLGRIAHEDDRVMHSGDMLVISLDFSALGGQECAEDDFERWFIQDSDGHGCILGHKQWYLRRKVGRDCYIGQKFTEAVREGVEEDCPCTQADYECDFNYVRQGEKCVPAVPETIPPGACRSSSGTYMGPSGYRLKAGSTCNAKTGIVMDELVEKDCSPPQLPEGGIGHRVFQFPQEVVQSEYLKKSQTILVRLRDGTIWQSMNEGYTWMELFPNERFLTFVTHPYSPSRAYLLTPSGNYYYTTDSGRSWYPMRAPLQPTSLGGPSLVFNPSQELLIWVGDVDCNGGQPAANCHTEAYYSTDHGRNWNFIQAYIRHCEWGLDALLGHDSSQIICESYREKRGNQRHFNLMANPLDLISGTRFYQEKRTLLLQNVVGYRRLPHHLLIAQYQEDTRSLAMQVSRNGARFIESVFPAGFHPSNRYFEILDGTPRSVVVHLTTSQRPDPTWGVLLKSDPDGSVFVLSLDYVNRNDRGNVDFTRLPVLKGIVLVNVIADPGDSMITGRKELVTRISHNDGGIWKPLIPPKKDSADEHYLCKSDKCALHLHAFSERLNSRSSVSIPSRPDLLISIGNVGEVLAPYKECNIFLSRDAGYTWSEIRKGTYIWAFGDRGSLLVMARDSDAIDRVIYSTDEGLTWHEYKLAGVGKVHVRSIVTLPDDSSRRFILFGYYARSMETTFVAIQLDFSFLTKKQCSVNKEDPNESDFELWSPAEVHQDRCLFGRQKFYQRRIRDRNCYIGDLTLPNPNKGALKNCPCTDADFECDINYVRDDSGFCVLEPGTTPRPSNTTCAPGEDLWYERTAYRRIGYTTCEAGVELDRGAAHECVAPVQGGWFSRTQHGWLFWSVVVYLLLVVGVSIAYAIFRCSGFARGKIRLADGDETETRSRPASSFLSILAAPLLFIVRGLKRIVQMLPFRGHGKSNGPPGRGEDEHLLSFEAEQGR